MVVIVILGIFVLLFFLVRYKGKKNLEANIAAEQQDVFEEMASFQNTIDYHGTTYQYRKDIVNILCIGVDKEEAMWERDDDGGSVGQADAVFLVSLDFEHSNIRILAIPRDTMVSIVACDENGNEMGAFTGQLALQYAYADGQEKSCSLVIGQVADILKNEVPINGYVAMNLSCIGTVNDAVGGVTVEMDDDYTLYNAKFKKGATVHLQGEEAQEFVQGRDITVSGSAYSRIGRQKRYLKAFISQAKKTLAQNPALAVNLMSQLSDYMLTDISTDEVLYISTELSGCNFDEENVQILQGNIQMGEKYEEYYLDDEAVQQTIIDLFYEEQREQPLFLWLFLFETGFILRGAEINEYIAGKEEKRTESIKAEKNSRLDSCADTLCHCRMLWRLSDLSSLECETAGTGVRKTPAGRNVKCCNRDGHRRAGDRGEHRRNSDLL